MKKIYKLFISIGICEAVGVLASFFTTSAVESWYPTLNKPAFTPPDWTFGLVWTILYALMGVALFKIWITEPDRTAITWFSIQLGLNFLWSIIFFGMQMPLIALIEIVLLLVSICITTYYFYRISREAAYLMVPYILWVAFAAVLNYSIVILNL